MNYHKVKDTDLYYKNLVNRPRPKHSASKYRGVGKGAHGYAWRVQVYYRGIKYFIGSYHDEIEAALAYNKAAYRIIGENAVLNKIDGYTEQAK